MNYIEISLTFHDSSFAEILEAELTELQFESFTLLDGKLQAYIPSIDYSEEEVNLVLESYSDAIIKANTKEIAHENWNAVWESNYPPVRIDDELFIGAAFHDFPNDVRFNIKLEPNMSFGTGHHPTTEQVLRYMSTLPLNGKRFMDFGCGSAILSIYAAFCGSVSTGIEIDAHAADAARHNLKLNNISNFDIVTGGIESLRGEPYDIIAADINRNIIEECLKDFHDALASKGWLICSGFLASDVPDLKLTIESSGFSIQTHTNIDDWAMIAAKKTL